MIEEVLEGVLFEAEAGVRYVLEHKTVIGGEPVKRSMIQPVAPLQAYLWRRIKAEKNGS